MSQQRTSIEDIRAILAEVEADEASDTAESRALTAEIAVLARWVSRRVPAAWRRRATEITDEPGHWDGSYGPDAHTVARTAQGLLCVWSADTVERPTSDGYYHSYEILTTEPGLYVQRDGRLIASVRSGTAALGQYAAHPGECDRDIHIEYREARPDLHGLRRAADLLRKMRESYLSASHDAGADEDVCAASKAGAAARAAAQPNT